MIYFYCPDNNAPSGGVRKIYRFADVLIRHGFPAGVVHIQPGFRCSWFENQTPVICAQTVRPARDDIFVVPEGYGPQIARVAPGIAKVIFNQNCYNTFLNYPIEASAMETPYLHPDIVGVITVSEDSAAYLRYAFPGQRVFRVRPAIDQSLFHVPAAKKAQIAFMPRRCMEEARQVISILKFRGVLADFPVLEIRDSSQEQAAALLRDSAFFFSFSGIEGFGLPPAEAMACGCLTIGFHGRGGKEFFRPEFSYPIEFGDIEGYARAAETLLQRYREDPAPLRTQANAAARFIHENYSTEREEADMVSCWRQIAEAAAD
jgi:hypothetical protein